MKLRFLLGISAAACIAAAPLMLNKDFVLALDQASITFGMFGGQISRTAFGVTGHNIVPIGNVSTGTKTVKMWGGGGGGAGGDSASASPNPGGGSGGGGSFVKFDWAFSATKGYVIHTAQGGPGGNSGANGGKGGAGGGASALFESTSVTTNEATSSLFTDTTGTVTKADNGDGTWKWTFPTSSATTTRWATTITVADKNICVIRIQATVRANNASTVRFGWSGDITALTNANFPLNTQGYQEFVVQNTQGSTQTLVITSTNTTTPCTIDIDYIEVWQMALVAMVAGGGGGSGGSNGNVVAVGAGGAGGGSHSATAPNGSDGAGTNAGHGGKGATTAAGGAGGTGGTGTDGSAGGSFAGGDAANIVAGTATMFGGKAGGATASFGGGPGGGGGGRYGGGGGEQAGDQNSSPGAGGGGNSNVSGSATNISSTAGSSGISGVDGGSQVQGGDPGGTSEAEYNAPTGRGGSGGGFGAGPTDGKDGYVVIVG